MAKVVGTADWRDRIETKEGIRTLALGPEAYVQVNDPRYVSDAYQYYLQGMGGGPDAATIPATTVTQAPAAPVTAGGDQGLAVAPGITGTSAAQNMGGAQNPLTQMITDPVTGQTQTVKQAMTSPEAYNIPGEMPKTPISGAFGPFEYLQPETSDPFLMSGAAGGASLPQIGYGEGEVDPKLAAAAGLTTDYPITQNPEAKSAWEKVQSGAASVADFAKKFGQGAVDAFKALTQFSPTLNVLSQIEPASGKQQQLVADQFVDEGVVLDDIGRIQQVGEYDTPENVMAGYTPGPTGLRIGDVSVGGGTIQESVVDRLETLEKTKNEKYGGSFYNEDGTPKLNPDTGEPTTLGAREEALKENLNMVARAAGAVTLEDYDPMAKKAGETTYATDYFPELGQEKTAPVTIEDIDPGFQTRFTAKDEGTFKGPGEISGVAGTTIVDPDTYMGSTVEGGLGLRGTINRTQPTAPVTGVEGPPSILSPEVYQDPIMEMAAEQAAAQAQAEADEAAANAREQAAQRQREEAASRAAAEQAAARKAAADAAAARARDRHTGDGAPKDTPSTPRDTGSDYGQFDRAVDRSTPDYSGVTTGGPPSRGGGGGGPPSQGGGGGGNSCFLKGTQVTMADGSTKAVEQVDLGDEVAVGGKVFAVGRFLNNELHDYKGIKVSGSHMVNEDGNWVRVEDSKHGKPLGNDEHTVYVFGAENRRILINDILFTDYFEVNEQEKLSEGDKFFDNWKIHAKVDSDNNVNVLNAN